MRVATAVAGILLLTLSAPVRAGDNDKVVPWQFKVQKGGKTTGRYDFSVVSGESGIRAVSMTYEDAKAVGKPKPPRPDVRTYVELDPNGNLGRYKRWKTRGKAALYWMAFVYEGKAKIRFEKEDGQSSKVTEIGPATDVAPLEPDQPLLAWLLVRPRAEREVTCMGTASTAPGKARVRKDGGSDAGATWKIEGDCGTFSVSLDAAGEPLVITADGRSWERQPVVPK